MLPVISLLFSMTPQIRDFNGDIKEGSIASLEKLKIGGIKQYVLIRGHDVRNPLLLLLHGGPASPEMPLAHYLESDLEQHFIVVNWDQRGAGKSYTKKAYPVHIKQYISDALELINYLRRRFKKRKIYLVGHSWGSILGLKLVKHHPELFHAYVGIGQVVYMKENQKRSLEFVYEMAKRTNNKKAIKELKKIKNIFYGDLRYYYIHRKWLQKFGGSIYNGKGRFPLSYFKLALFSPEYSIFDYLRLMAGFMRTIRNLWKEIFGINFFKEIKEVKVPIYFCEGKNDYVVPSAIAEKYFRTVKAPLKRFIWFEKSAHSPNLEENGKFENILINKVLPETYFGSDNL